MDCPLPGRKLFRSFAPLLAAFAITGRAAHAQAVSPAPARCDTTTSLTGSTAAGARIATVRYVTEPPASTLPAFARFVERLHATTRASTLRRDFRAHVGDTVDTIALAEAMRRLRQRAYLASAAVRTVRCGGSDTVSLDLLTRDKWSLNPSFSAQSNSSYGGLEERNVFGTGRAASVLVATRQGKAGFAAGFTDPYLFTLPLFARVRGAHYIDGDELRARFRTAESSVLDLWRAQLALAHYRQDTRRVQRVDSVRVLTEQAFHRDGAFLLLGRRVDRSMTGALSVLFGADFESASLNAPDRALTVGPHLVERRYHGATVGLTERTARFDTVGWVGRRDVIVDVPLGFEFEGVVSGGREDRSRAPAAFGSVWGGRMWTTRPGQLMLADVWASGYHVKGRENFDAASARANAAMYQRSHGLLYTLRFSAEKLVNPDPDVRALATVDPTIVLVPQAFRLSENAFAGQAEVAHHLPFPIRSIGLDVAAFADASVRRASALSQHDQLNVAVVGAGLRVLPGAPGSGWLRLDMMYPLNRDPRLLHRPRFAVSVMPWILADRQRNDPRLAQ